MSNNSFNREELIKKDNEFREWLKHNPKSREAFAYKLGLKDANIELSKPIGELLEIVNKLDKEKRK
jgi:hypothetical protein